MPKKILLADDSLTIQKVVELTFSDSDYDLICVSNGQKALDRIREDRPDLVLADVVMPEKNGYEVCEAIKGDPATARIPVMLLSGTFEPFDRERAERIGADSIVSKPFDSQQLIAQVEALLERPADRDDLRSPAVESSVSSSSTAPESEEPPFDVGFSAEDFTASVRVPPRGIDPFEEEYGRGDVDSAIEAFERSNARSGEEAPSSNPHASASGSGGDHGGPEQWLRDEPEKVVERQIFSSDHASDPAFEVEIDSEATVAIPMPLPMPGHRADEAPTAEIPVVKASSSAAEPESIVDPMADEANVEEPLPSIEPAAPTELDGGPETSASSHVSREIEVLAQSSSIPELTQMLSSVARSAGGDLTEDQIDQLARRVVERLSDRIVREIAWEVIPDVAEIVIKQRIKELEAGIE